MQENTEGMIALLPTETGWCNIELPHLTLVYLGEISDFKVTSLNDLVKEVISASRSTKPLMLKVLKTEVFGDDEKVDVFRLEETKELLTLRSRFEEYDGSEFPFRPHVTIGPAGGQAMAKPLVLTFDRILLAWGDRQFHYRLEG